LFVLFASLQAYRAQRGGAYAEEEIAIMLGYFPNYILSGETVPRDVCTQFLEEMGDPDKKTNQ
jgi:hypothetical protein